LGWILVLHIRFSLPISHLYDIMAGMSNRRGQVEDNG
jgi:hypothetical protein